MQLNQNTITVTHLPAIMQSNLDSLSTPTILFTNFSNPAFVAAEHIPTYGIIKRKIQFKAFNTKFGNSFYLSLIFYWSLCLLYAYKFVEALLFYFLHSFLSSFLKSYPTPSQPISPHLISSQAPLLSSFIATHIPSSPSCHTHTHTYTHTDHYLQSWISYSSVHEL